MASNSAFCARFGQSVWRVGCFGIVLMKEKAGSETSLTEYFGQLLVQAAFKEDQLSWCWKIMSKCVQVDFFECA